MNAASYLFELTALLNGGPDRRVVIDSHGNRWERSDEGTLTHESFDRVVTVEQVGAWVGLRVREKDRDER